uniref:Uncharacterized protein n=1 Tax=Nelumbo nucifera TaxID=4432 RepID=A0A822YF57_NELNU|nr:TPA_asm: hypothetical protein HUJ06_009634 [Nelumbo nucifera]
MNIDFWASRVHSNKHLTAMQAARLNSGITTFPPFLLLG